MTALSARSGKAIATFLNFYVSHGSIARFLRGGETINSKLKSTFCQYDVGHMQQVNYLHVLSSSFAM